MTGSEKPAIIAIQHEISAYKKVELVEIVAGLLTLPRLAANAVRLEALAQIAVANANGRSAVTRRCLERCLNELLCGANLHVQEDPSEDVFVSNVRTSFGDLLIFNSLWEGNDYYVQVLLDSIESLEGAEYLLGAKDSCISLLKMSNEVARRANLIRNSCEESVPKGKISIPPSSDFSSLSSRIRFSPDELVELGINTSKLDPFILQPDEYLELNRGSFDNNLLHRKPLLQFGDNLVVALPGAIGIAIRYYFVRQCRIHSALEIFENLIHAYQTHQLQHEILWEFRGKATSVDIVYERPDNLPALSSITLCYENSHYIQAVLLHDELSELDECGMANFRKLTDEQLGDLQAFLSHTARHCEQMANFQSGRTFLSHGGLGGGHFISLEKVSDDWSIHSITLGDQVLISRSQSDALTTLDRCLKEKDWFLDRGVELFNINGDFNYFAYWKSSGYICLPNDLEATKSTMFYLGTEFIFAERKTLRQTNDRHTAQDINGNWISVERLTKDSFYLGMLELPIYVSIENISSGYMNGLMETDLGNIWFGVSKISPHLESNAIFEWWQGFISLVYEAVRLIAESSGHVGHRVYQIDLDLSKVREIEPEDLGQLYDQDIGLTLHERAATLVFEERFLSNFTREANVGERLLIAKVCEAIAALLSQDDVSVGSFVDSAVENVLSEEGVRIIHAFRTFDQTDIILRSSAKPPELVDSNFLTFHRIQINTENGYVNQMVEGSKSCTNILHGVVDAIWIKIQSLLKEINQIGLIYGCIEQINSVEEDRRQWRRTAKAVKAIYSMHGDVLEVAAARESERSLTSMCLRALVEMAICDSPLTSGRKPTSKDIEKLSSLVALLINTATDSDSIHWGLVAPSIEFYPNGLYSLASDLNESVLRPYFNSYFEQGFNEAIDEYGDLYNLEAAEGAHDDGFSEEFESAFLAEYDIGVHDFLEISGAIVEILVESQLAILSIERNELANRIAACRNIELESVEQYFSHFSIVPREAWSDIPEGCATRDIMPWKFKRRISCLTRPLVSTTSGDFICSLILLKQGISYFLSRTYSGLFHNEFFDSKEMKSYVGVMVDQRGAQFTESVYHWASKNINGLVRKEVLMPTIGAPQEFGDIDVLALTTEGKLILIECKDLQMAKTVSEIADVCNRFRGEEKDELRKHLNRLDWICQNIETVQRQLSTPIEIVSVEHALITSRELPIVYTENLPLDKDRIIAFRNKEGLINLCG